MGFKVTAVMGIKGEPKTFNMDVTLEASIARTGGLQYIGVEGNGYVMNELGASEEGAKVRASVDIKYYNHPGPKRMEGNMAIFVNYSPYLSGHTLGKRSLIS